MHGWQLILEVCLLLCTLAISCDAFVVHASGNCAHRRSLRPLASKQQFPQLLPLRGSHALQRHNQQRRHDIRLYASSTSAARLVRKERSAKAKQSTGKLEAGNDLAFLQSLFDGAAVQGRLSRDRYFGGNDVKFLLDKGLIDLQLLNELWDIATENASSSDIGFHQYLALQYAIDQAVEVPDKMQQQYKHTKLPDYNALRGFSIADATVPGVYDLKMQQFLRDQFSVLSGGESFLTFNQFAAQWRPMVVSCLKIGIRMEDVKDIWMEHVDAESKHDGRLNVESFIAFNARIDQLVQDFNEQVIEALDQQAKVSSEKKRQMYDQLYTHLTRGVTLLNFHSFISWDQIRRHLETGILSESRLRQLFNAFPYEAGEGADNFGINRENFVELMVQVDAELRNAYRTLHVDRPALTLQPTKGSTSDAIKMIDTFDLSSLGTSHASGHLPGRADAVSIESVALDSASSSSSLFLSDTAQETNLARSIDACILNLTTSAQWKGQNISSVAASLVGEWELVLTNHPALCARRGISALLETLPTARFCSLTETVTAVGGAEFGKVKLAEDISLVTGNVTALIIGAWELTQTPLLTGAAPRIAQRNNFNRITLGTTDLPLDQQQQVALRVVERLEVAFVGEKLKVLRDRASPESFIIFKRKRM